VATISDEDDLMSVVGAAFGNAGLDVNFDWAGDANTKTNYAYWSTIGDPFKAYLYLQFGGLGFGYNACDDIYFHDVYDEVTGEWLRREASISGSYNIGSIVFNSEDVYYNGSTDSVVVIAQSDRFFGYMKKTALDGRLWCVALLNGFYYPMEALENAGIIGGSLKLGDLAYVYPAFVASGSALFIRLDNDILSSIGSKGNIVQVGSKYYYNANNNFIFYVGSGGFTPDLVAEYKDYIVADVVTDPSLLIQAEVAGVLADIVDTPDLCIGGLTFSVITTPTAELDEKIAELIQQQPWNFPLVGQAVLERSKRVVSKMILG